MKLFVHEIFNSISGESGGPTIPQGSACTFVRLQGCNLRCTWCDTTHAQIIMQNENLGSNFIVKYMDIENIIKKCTSDRIIITGGEPLVQQKNLCFLVEKLCNKKKHVQIETNGSHIPFMGDQLEGVDWIMDYKLSSSGQTQYMLSPSIIGNLLKGANVFLKFVFATQKDIDQAMDLVHYWWPVLDNKRTPQIIFSPLDGGISPVSRRLCKGLVKKFHNEDYQSFCMLSVQIHKILELQ